MKTHLERSNLKSNTLPVFKRKFKIFDVKNYVLKNQGRWPNSEENGKRYRNQKKTFDVLHFNRTYIFKSTLHVNAAFFFTYFLIQFQQS